MKYPKRKPNRLPGYEYQSENYYFVTICTKDKKSLFGTVGNLNIYSFYAKEALLQISEHFKQVQIDSYVIMPNHIHAIIVIGCSDETHDGKGSLTLSTIIGSYKSGVTRRIHQREPNLAVWQKSFYDHVIRNEESCHRIREYIAGNPWKWTDDEYYTE